MLSPADTQTAYACAIHGVSAGNNRNGWNMPDELRTRIAKVLHQRGTARDDVEEGWVWTWGQESEYEQQSWLEDADAVIRELDLQRERLGEAEGYPHPQTRYVTEWEEDD